jgi:hypothetical protein
MLSPPGYPIPGLRQPALLPFPCFLVRESPALMIYNMKVLVVDDIHILHICNGRAEIVLEVLLGKDCCY